MKKLIALIVVCAMSFALFGCGKKDSGKSSGDTTKATTQAKDDEDKGSKDASGEDSVKFSQKGEQVIFSVDSKFDLMQDAWLGFIPGTKGYTKEGEADEYDVLYTYIENVEKKSSENYQFVFDTWLFEGLEDGDYVLVLCDSDDESVGKVLFYMPAKINSGKITLDYDKIVINK